MPPDSLVLIVVTLCNQETALYLSVMWNCQRLRGGAFLWPEVWHGHYWHNYWPQQTSIFICSQHDSLEPQHATWDIMARKCSSVDGKILKMSSMWWEPCQSGKWIPRGNVCWQRSPHILSHRPLVCPSKSLTDQFLAGVESARRLARLRLFVTVLNIQTPHSAPFLSLSLTPETTPLVKLHTWHTPITCRQETGGNGEEGGINAQSTSCTNIW